MKSKKTINDVKNFWNNNTLFTGENNDLENPSFFFKKHNETVYKIFLGKKNILDKIYFPIDDLEIKKKSTRFRLWYWILVRIYAR